MAAFLTHAIKKNQLMGFSFNFFFIGCWIFLPLKVSLEAVF